MLAVQTELDVAVHTLPKTRPGSNRLNALATNVHYRIHQLLTCKSAPFLSQREKVRDADTLFSLGSKRAAPAVDHSQVTKVEGNPTDET